MNKYSGSTYGSNQGYNQGYGGGYRGLEEETKEVIAEDSEGAPRSLETSEKEDSVEESPESRA